MAPCVGAVDGNTLAVAVSVSTCVSILSVCVSVSVCVSGTHAQLCYWLNPQIESGICFPQPGQRPWVPGHQVGLQWPGRITGLEWLEEVAMHSNIT